MKKKLLSIEDLVRFCEMQNFSEFNSKDTGYSLSVHTPATFEIEENSDESKRGLLKLKVKVYHKGKNRNKSSIPDDAAEEAKESIKNRPVLAAIHQLDDGEWDFESHNMDVSTDEDGNEIIEYIEKQVGSFSEEEPFFEYDEDVDKDFCCAYAYIPEEYTKAAEIIKRKDGTKTSCELSVDEFAYDAKEKALVLKKFYVAGVTLLGSRKDGTPIGEGMLGARADIVDFSQKNNSIAFNVDNVEILKEINQKLDKLVDFTENNSEKGGNTVMKLDELLAKYNVSLEELTFEVEGLSDEELVSAFEDAFANDEEDTTPETVENADDTDVEDETATDEDVEGIDETTEVSNSLEYAVVVNGTTKNFELSYNEIEAALYTLVNDTYSEADNTWYSVIVYEDYLVMTSWGDKDYKQTYTRNGDEFTLTGDRVEVYATFLTAEEKEELDKLRSNYALVSERLTAYEVAEADAKKDAILAEEAYAQYLETDEFKELAENRDEYSVDELAEKAELAFSKCVKRLGFSSENNSTGIKAMRLIGNEQKNKKHNRYGTLKFN